MPVGRKVGPWSAPRAWRSDGKDSEMDADQRMWRVPEEAWLAEQIDQQALTHPPPYSRI